jgi:hypothetical protein
LKFADGEVVETQRLILSCSERERLYKVALVAFLIGNAHAAQPEWEICCDACDTGRARRERVKIA